ncbi:MAG: M20/M25/M40 family metallo-hydrolase, partial [Bryobacteraceae bacterium]
MFKLSCLILLGLVSLTAASLLPPEEDQRLAREIYKEMIESKSGFTTGETTGIAKAMAERLKTAGFPESDIWVGGAKDTKYNLVVLYHGTGARKPILLLAHTDVVEAKREDWSMDPFQFIEKDGYFYGRGTADDKAQAAVWIANLIRYKREGFKPDRDLIVALTADEEGGGPYNGVDWLLKNKRELIEADYALNEGGRGESVDGKRIANDIGLAEKTYADFRFEVRNKGGHSSRPVPDNAIYHLAGALYRLSGFLFPMRLNDVTRAYFGQMAKIEKGQFASDLAQVAQGSQEAMKRIAAESPGMNSMLRTTCVATQLEG